MKQKSFFVLLLLLSVQLLQAQTIERKVINSCGGQLHPQLIQNVGETIIGSYSGNNSMLTQGFIQPAAILYLSPIAGNNNLCVGATTLLSDSISGGFWSCNDTTVAIIDANGLVTGITPGIVTISYTIGEVSTSLNIAVHALPIVNAGNNQAVCFGNSVTLNASGATSLIWNNNVVNGQSFTPSSTQQYTVVGTDAFGCSSSGQVTVVVHNLPSVSAGADQSVCLGNTITLSGSGAVNYSWNNSVTNNQSFVPTSNASYEVIGTDANGCSNKDTVSVTVNQLPISNATTYQPVICPNGNTTLFASGGVSFLWSNGDTATNTTVGQAGNYYVVASNQYGCTDTSNLVAIVQKTLPTQVKIKTVGLSSVCYPALVSFVLDMPLGSTTGFAYQWYSQGAPIAGATDSFYNANTTGSYALSVYGGDNCSKFSYAKPATIKPAPTASFTANSPTTICSGGFVTLVAPTISGCTYTWLKDGVSAGSGNTKLFKLSGNYTVIAKINGCSDTASPALPIIVNPLPVASVAAINATNFCSGDSCTIIASPTGAVSYEWHNGTFILDTTATEQFKVGVTATIKVLVKDANGCIGKLSTTSVKTKVNAIPMASISSSGSTTISSTGNVKLKATPSSGVTWQWYKDGNAINNATANSYIANSGGNYTVAITKLGCTGLSSGVLVTQTNPKSEAVTVIEGSFELSAYPNPVSEVLTISVRGIDEINGTIQIMDFNGRLVAYQEMKQVSTTINMEGFASGVYWVRFRNSLGETGIVKITKQ